MSINNALGLYGPSEKALMALALKYELVTGIQVKLRKSETAIIHMVKESLTSRNNELTEKARQFIDSLPKSVKWKMLNPDSAQKRTQAPKKPIVDKTKVRTYRGVVIPDSQPENNPKEKITNDTHTSPAAQTKKRVWRGATYDE